MITYNRLREALDYCPETGHFIWKIRPSGRANPGDRAGCLSPNGYWQIGLDTERHNAHRLAWLWMMGHWPEDEIDHIDGNPSNNAWPNLRNATSSLNKQNIYIARKNNLSTGLLGAYTHGERFKASIMAQEKQIHLGVFDTAKEAHKAYLVAKRQLHAGCMI